MQAHADLPRSASGIIPVLASHGFEMWDAVCSNSDFYEPNVFRTGDIIKLFCKEFGWGERTAQAYSTGLLNNIMLTQDQDNPCLRKVRNGLWQLVNVNYN